MNAGKRRTRDTGVHFALATPPSGTGQLAVIDVLNPNAPVLDLVIDHMACAAVTTFFRPRVALFRLCGRIEGVPFFALDVDGLI